MRKIILICSKHCWYIAITVAVSWDALPKNTTYVFFFRFSSWSLTMTQAICIPIPDLLNHFAIDSWYRWAKNFIAKSTIRKAVSCERFSKISIFCISWWTVASMWAFHAKILQEASSLSYNRSSFFFLLLMSILLTKFFRSLRQAARVSQFWQWFSCCTLHNCCNTFGSDNAKIWQWSLMSSQLFEQLFYIHLLCISFLLLIVSQLFRVH